MNDANLEASLVLCLTAYLAVAFMAAWFFFGDHDV